MFFANICRSNNKWWPLTRAFDLSVLYLFDGSFNKSPQFFVTIFVVLLWVLKRKKLCIFLSREFLKIFVCVLSKKLVSKTIDLLRSFICTSDNGNSLWCSELGTSRKSHTTESVWNSGLGVRVAINLSTCVDIAKRILNFLLVLLLLHLKFLRLFFANPINTKNYNFRYWLICPWCPCFFWGVSCLLVCVFWCCY